MKKTMFAVLLFGLLVAATATATTTWTAGDSGDRRTATAVTTTGTEAAPTLSTQGFGLSGARGFSVHVESACVLADGGCTYPAFSAGTLKAYLLNPVTNKWGRAPKLDCEVPSASSASCSGYRVEANWGRVAFIPAGLGASTALNVYVVSDQGVTAEAMGSAGATSSGEAATPLLDGDKRTVVATGVIAGACLGADLTTTSADGPTIPAGAEYRFCALTDLWISWAGGTAAADAPSEPVFARTCVVRGPFSAQTIPTAILPAGAAALSGKELVACPVTRPQ